jgi:hypothetical protein
MLLRWMMEGKIIVGTVDLLTVLMIVLLSRDGRLVAPGGARSSMPKKAGANNLPAGSVSKLRQEQDTGSEWLLLALDWQTLMPSSECSCGRRKGPTAVP